VKPLRFVIIAPGDGDLNSVHDDELRFCALDFISGFFENKGGWAFCLLGRKKHSVHDLESPLERPC
jgi:hypothetical protein